MANYYAVCDANGPISVLLDAETEAEARQAFEALDQCAAIDNARTDAENDLEIAGEGMSENAFAEALEIAGCVMIRDMEPVHNYHAGTTAHLAGGWRLWRADSAR